MKKVTALNLSVGGSVPLTRTASLLEIPKRVLTKVEPVPRGTSTQRCIAFVRDARRALSQYYDWLKRTDKPW
jgi:hypothetical protein